MHSSKPAARFNSREYTVLALILPQQRRLLQAEHAGAVVVPRRGARQLARRGPVSEVEEEVGEVEQRVIGVVRRRRGAGLGVLASDIGGGGRCREIGGRGERGGGLDVLGRGGGRARELARQLREVEVRSAALDGERGHVVRAGGHLGGGERAEPDARLLPRLPDLRHPLAPRAHPHAAVRRVVPVVAPALLAAGHGGGGGRRRAGRGGRRMGRRGRGGLGARGRVVRGCHGSCVGGVSWEEQSRAGTGRSVTVPERGGDEW
jgi:hypothetical protein